VGAFANATDDDNDGVAQLNTPDGAWAVHYQQDFGGISMVRLSDFDSVPEPPHGVWSPSRAWGAPRTLASRSWRIAAKP